MRKQLCTFVEDPRDILSNLTKPEETERVPSSFWDRIKFLVAENGIQRYVVESLIEPRYMLLKIRKYVKKKLLLSPAE